MWSTKQKMMGDVFYFICLFYKDKLTKMAPSTKPEEVLAMFHCPLCQHAAHARTSRYITDTTKERYCNFAFFSGLIDAQFWAGSAQPKSPELTANCC